jgi:RNA polymerase sigma-70 factor (ECF subfamily)
MAASKSPVLGYIRKVASGWQAADLPDPELLEQFVGRRDEAAFAVIVRRHGPMVRRLCLRILQNEQDADDAFQATFLVLCRKAGWVDRKQSLGGWLHGVAYRVAQKARIASARRQRHERCSPARRLADPLAEVSLKEAHAILDDELARLPDKFRGPLVLCYLEGRTRDEAAHQLGWSASIFKSRLEQARQRLARRLAARGLGLAGTLVAALFCETTARAAVPAVLLDSTIKAATGVMAGVTASAIPPRVAALAEGVLKAMFITRLKIATAVLLVAGFIGAGTSALAPGALAARQSETSAETRGDKPPADADQPMSDNDRLQGTWEFAAWTQGGQTKKRDDFGEEDARPKSLKFTGDKLLTVMLNTGGKEVEFRYVFKLDPSQKPKAIDLTPDGEPKGTSGPGVYEVEGDGLRVCFPGQPDQERPGKLESKEGDSYLLLTYKRVARDVPKGGEPADTKARGRIRATVDGPDVTLRLDGKAGADIRATIDGPDVTLHLDNQGFKGAANAVKAQGDNTLRDQVRKWAWQVDSVDGKKGTIKLRRASSPAFFGLEMTVAADAKIVIDGRQTKLADVQSLTCTFREGAMSLC